MSEHHIMDIPQVDGTVRRLYAASQADADEARAIVRDRGGCSTLDHWPELVSRIEDVDGEG